MHRRSFVEFQEKLFPDLNLQVELASRAQRSTAARDIAGGVRGNNGEGDLQSTLLSAAAGITSSATLLCSSFGIVGK